MFWRYGPNITGFVEFWDRLKKWPFSGRSNLTEIDQTHFPLPRSHTSFKNYEIWILAIVWHPGPNKSGFVKFQGRLQNIYFPRLYILYSDLSENSFGHYFWLPLWNFDFSDSLERYWLTDLNIFGFTKIRYILHPAQSVKVWIQIFKLTRYF